MVAVVVAVMVAAFAAFVGAIAISEHSENSKELHATAQADLNIHVGGSPNAVAVTPRNVWLLDTLSEKLRRLDPRQNKVVGELDLGAKPASLLYGAGRLWVALQDGTIAVVDDNSTAVVDRIPAASGVSWSLQMAAGRMWAASGVLRRLNPDTGTVDATANLPPGSELMGGTAAGPWVYDPKQREIFRIDPDTLATTARIRVPAGLRALAADNDALWVTRGGDSHLRRLDPLSGREQSSIVVGPRAGDVAIASDGVWVASEGELGYIGGDIAGHTVSRIDPATNRITASVRVINHPGAIAVGPDGTLWVLASTDYPGWLSRIAPRTH